MSTAPDSVFADAYGEPEVVSILQGNDVAGVASLLEREPTNWSLRHFYASALSRSFSLEKLADWARRHPRSPDAHLIWGARLMQWAMAGRGRGPDDTIPEGARRVFHQRLTLAKQVLGRSATLNEEDPTPWAYLVMVGVHERNTDEQIKAFEQATARAPDHWGAHVHRLMGLSAAHGGSHQAMFQFARHAAARPGADRSWLPGLILKGHAEYYKQLHLGATDEARVRSYVEQREVRYESLKAYRAVGGAAAGRAGRGGVAGDAFFVYVNAAGWLWSLRERDLLRDCFERLGPRLRPEHWNWMGDASLDEARAFVRAGSSYDIVLTGDIEAGRTHEEVVRAMAVAFRRPLSSVERLLSGGSRVIKRNLEQDQVRRYLSAITKTGAAAQVLERESGEDVTATFTGDGVKRARSTALRDAVPTAKPTGRWVNAAPRGPLPPPIEPDPSRGPSKLDKSPKETRRPSAERRKASPPRPAPVSESPRVSIREELRRPTTPSMSESARQPSVAQRRGQPPRDGGSGGGIDAMKLGLAPPAPEASPSGVSDAPPVVPNFEPPARTANRPRPKRRDPGPDTLDLSSQLAPPPAEPAAPPREPSGLLLPSVDGGLDAPADHQLIDAGPIDPAPHPTALAHPALGEIPDVEPELGPNPTPPWSPNPTHASSGHPQAPVPVPPGPPGAPAPVDADPFVGQRDFYGWLGAQGMPAHQIPLAQEYARAFVDAAGGVPLSSGLIDSVLWAQESAGMAGVRLQLMREVGHAMLRFQVLVPAAWVEAAGTPAPPGGAAPMAGAPVDALPALGTPAPTAEPPVEPSPPVTSSWNRNGGRIERLRQHIAARVQCQTSRSRLSPRAADCCRVGDVASLSPASEFGIRKGDLVSMIDGSPASEFRVASVRSCTVHSRNSGVLEIRAAQPIHLGFALEDTAVTLKRGFEGDPEVAGSLWELGEYQAIRELVEPRIKGRFNKIKEKNTPLYLLWAAAIYELGQHNRAVHAIREWLEEYASGWTSNYAAIGLFYLGIDAYRRGEDGLPFLERAYRNSELDRVIDEIEKMTGRRLPKHYQPWLGKRFPLMYEAPRYGQPGQVGLREPLAALQDDQLHVVCLLGRYRWNGPSEGWLRDYPLYREAFGRFLAGLHLLTAAPVPDVAWTDEGWTEGEARLREHGVPFELLCDEEGRIFNTTGVPGSPTMFFVDSQGVVRGQYICPDGVDIWNALAELAAAD